MILPASGVKASFGHADLFGPMADASYFLIPEDYLLKEFLPFWRIFKRTVGIAYREGRTDCDDFALAFKAQIINAALSLDTNSAPAVGIAQVTNHIETLGIPPGNHVLNFVGILRNDQPAWVMLDSNTDRHEDLSGYRPTFRSLSI